MPRKVLRGDEMKPDHRTRKEQIEKDFAVSIWRMFRMEGVPLSRRMRRKIREELKGAAMVGAAEERHRTLNMIHYDPVLTQRVVKDSVLKVLGYQQ